MSTSFLLSLTCSTSWFNFYSKLKFRQLGQLSGPCSMEGEAATQAVGSGWDKQQPLILVLLVNSTICQYSLTIAHLSIPFKSHSHPQDWPSTLQCTVESTALKMNTGPFPCIGLSILLFWENFVFHLAKTFHHSSLCCWDNLKEIVRTVTACKRVCDERVQLSATSSFPEFPIYTILALYSQHYVRENIHQQSWVFWKENKSAISVSVPNPLGIPFLPMISVTKEQRFHF